MEILLFAVGGALGVMIPLFLSRCVAPRRPNEEKLTTYECGENPTGTAWGKFNIRFYVVALIFVLFETELLFLFPWAIIFADERLINETQGQWGILAAIEMGVFILVLAVGLAYVWGKGFLEWQKNKVKPKDIASPVPEEFYAKLNDKYAKPTQA